MNDDVIDGFDPDVEMPIEDEYAGEHAETMIEGILDTVQGNESYQGGLTRAQQYLTAVLGCEGIIFDERHGTEGMVDKIKAGFHKAWEAVKRAFKLIWSFFFDKKIEHQAKVIFDTVKEHRTSAEKRLKDYKGDVSQEAMKKRLDSVEKLEKMLDEKHEAMLAKTKEFDGDLYFQKPFFKIMKEAVADIKVTYGLMDVLTAIKKPSDLSTAFTKLEAITKQIVQHQEKVRGAKNSIDAMVSSVEEDLKKPQLNRELITKALALLKQCAAIFEVYITCVQRKLNCVNKLVSSLDRVFPAQAAS